jgi:uncharacterized membrane protein
VPVDESVARTPSSGPTDPAEVDKVGFERLIFFSDAVFAIAITLLIIDIHVPENAGSDLAGALRHLAPNFEGFVISFLVIAVYWMSHHRIFRRIRSYDAPLIWINTITLMAIVFIPFSTSLVSGYGNQALAVIFYAINLAVIGLLFLVLWLYAAYPGHLIDRATSPTIVRWTAMRLGIPPLVFLLSVPIAFVNPTAANFWWLMIPVLSRIVGRVEGID